MKSIQKFFAQHFVRPLLERYLLKERTYRYSGLSVQVLPGVFHPGFFFSTIYLLQYLLEFNLEKKTVLELGAGSGLISFAVERKGAVVTSTDLGIKAIENLQLNRKLLKSNITIIHSNLFEKIQAMKYSYIVINPPYYAKQPNSDAALAWFCGANFEYFQKLFSSIFPFMDHQTQIIMVLSEDCNLQRIQSIATENNLLLEEVSRKKFWWEWNYLFKITKNESHK